MLEIKGLFTTGKIKGVGTGEVLTIVNSTKNKDGNYEKTYYQMWLNEKTLNMLTRDQVNKIYDGNQYLILNIEGYLNVTKNNNFTNLTIIPTNITVYERNNNHGNR